MGKKIIVIYKSKYGSTEKYANWLGRELRCDVLKREKVKFKDLIKYDTIIYGGGVYGKNIKGFDLIKNNIDKLSNKKIIVFAVGNSIGKEKEVNEILDSNLGNELKDKISFIYLRGGFNFEELNFLDKNIMKMIRNRLVNKTEALTEEERFLLSCYEKKHDWTDESKIQDIIKYV